MTVDPSQRWSAQQRCPACNGYESLKRGVGQRCTGYAGSDGATFYCSREEFSDNCELLADAGVYLHRFGACECGQIHAASDTPGDEQTIIAEHAYDLKLPDGTLKAVKHRIDFADGSKEIYLTGPQGQKRLGFPQADLPLYPMDDVLGLDDDGLIVIVEGEKAADALIGIGLATLGTTTGAKIKQTIVHSRSVLEHLRGRRIALWPDNDEAGYAHMRALGKQLLALGCTVQVLVWPDAPPKGDAADYVELHGAHGIDQLLAGAVTFSDRALRWETQIKRISRRQADEITPEAVELLFGGRLARGKSVMDDGDPGTGKSTLGLLLAAAFSTGRAFPDGSPGVDPANVLIFSAEDDPSDTIVPRLIAAGADLARITIVHAVDVNGESRLPALPDDVDVIEDLLCTTAAGFLVLDPLPAFVHERYDLHKDQHARRALMPLNDVLARRRCVGWYVRHLNKSALGQAMYRGGGSIGIVGAARAAFLLAVHPDDVEKRVFANYKNNFAPLAPSLVFRSEAGPLGAARLVCEGQTELRAADLLAPPDDSAGDAASKLEEACDFLILLLRGGPVDVPAIKKAAKAADIAWMTVRRAKVKLGITHDKSHAADGPWLWTMPDSEAAHSALPQKVEQVEHLRDTPADAPDPGPSVEAAQDAQLLGPKTDEQLQRVAADYRVVQVPYGQQAGDFVALYAGTMFTYDSTERSLTYATEAAASEAGKRHERWNETQFAKELRLDTAGNRDDRERRNGKR
jgi:hypothetical protein